METLKALGEHVVAKVIKRDQKTDGGIIIPDTVKKVPQAYCRVVSIGENVGISSEILSAGDIIACHERGGMDIIMNGDVYKVLKYNEIYGKVLDISTDYIAMNDTMTPDQMGG